MKVTVEIPDDEIEAKVANLITERLARQMFEQYGGGYIFRKDIKAEIRALLKEHLDDVTDEAIKAAANSIVYKGTKKLLEKAKEQDNE